MKALLRHTLIVIMSLLINLNVYSTENNILQELAAKIPGVETKDIAETPIPGLYQIVVGAQVMYISADARFIFYGELVERSSGKNLTTPVKDSARLSLISKLDESEMIIFKPKQPKHTVTVFTDIDCGYCRKLHSEMAQYNELGIEIRYLSYPRAGVDSKSYKKAVNVWCAKDRQKAITDAKSNIDVKSNKCESPVKKHMQLAYDLGVSGTPNLILEDGRMVPGYVPAKQLLNVLEKKDPSSVAKKQ